MAIQDSMGWLDYHLHQFCIKDKAGLELVKIGIPDDDFDNNDFITPSRETGIKKYFKAPGDSVLYEYDFGDNWEHKILLEGMLLGEKGATYPKCIAGERACPPEDCHGIHGYAQLLKNSWKTRS